MTPEERNNWEAKLTSDASFAAEILPYSNMYESIQLKGDQLLNDQLQSLGQQLLNAPPQAISKPLYQQTSWLIAAAAAVVLLFSLIFTLTPTQNSEALFAENFKPGSGSRGNDTTLTPFLDAYNKGAYQEAISIYQQELANSQAALQSNVKLYLGVSYLAQNQTDSALAILSHVGKEMPAIYDDAQWYLALTYLKMNDLEEAKSRLQLIAKDTHHDWHRDASKILEDL
jgi:hypothetical protein